MGHERRHTVRRSVSWLNDLAAYIESVRRTKPQPGKLDCALFCADAVRALTGTDLAAEFRGRYSTFEGGHRLLRREGWLDVTDFLQAHFEAIHISQAQVGDIALVPLTNNGMALGVVQGAHIFILGETGLQLTDLLNGKKAFRI